MINGAIIAIYMHMTTRMQPFTVCYLVCSALVVHAVAGISPNEAEILQIYPGDKVRAREGMRLVVNCTSFADSYGQQMLWNASRGNDHMTSVALSNSTVALVFVRVHRSDAGFYTCYLVLSRGITYFKTVHISVSPRYTVDKTSLCASTQFRCGTGLCIFLHYRCDNKDDCGDNSDEENCGDDPCGNKFMCGNNRCISHDLVCDKFHNDDCEDMTDEMCLFKEFPGMMEVQTVSTNRPLQTSVDRQMRWLKTTVYSVIGCTVGVVLFIAAVVIAIFRLKMKRAATRRQMSYVERRRREYSMAQRACRFHEADPFMGGLPQNSLPPYCHNSIILNINNGVQYVPGLECTSLMEAPPPYSDSGVEYSPPRSHSPPPPYSTLDRRNTTRDDPQHAGGDNSDVSNCPDLQL